MAEYRLPKERRIDVSGSPFTRESFDVEAFKRPIVGRFGEQANGPDPAIRYRLPQYDPERLGALDDTALQRMLAEADTGYDTLEQQWQGYTPQYADGGAALGRDAYNPGDAGSSEGYRRLLGMGYRAIEGEDGEGNGVTSWVAPGDAAGYDAGMAENQRRSQALGAIQAGQAAIQAELARRRQMELYQRNQLMGGIAEQGYSFAPGSLADTSVQDEIWQNRERLPFFLKQQAAARNYLRGPNDQNPDGFQWRPRRPIDWNGAEYDPSTDPGPEVETGTSYRLPQAMPYDPADPLSEAAYYGGQSADPNAMVGYKPDPYQSQDQDTPFTNPDGWEPDPNYNPADGRMDMRYRRKLRPYAEGDRMVRPAGDKGYGNLRPGFYNAGSITGPSAPQQPVFQQPVFQLPQEPDFRPMRPVFEPSRVGPAPTRSVTGRQTLRSGVSVRNPLSAPRRQSPFG